MSLTHDARADARSGQLTASCPTCTHRVPALVWTLQQLLSEGRTPAPAATLTDVTQLSSPTLPTRRRRRVATNVDLDTTASCRAPTCAPAGERPRDNPRPYAAAVASDGNLDTPTRRWCSRTRRRIALDGSTCRAAYLLLAAPLP